MSGTAEAPTLVLGMHRSGTSFLASRLAGFGVAMGEQLIGAQPGNPRGHFEDAEVLAFHEAVITRLRGTSERAFDRTMMVTEPFSEGWNAEEEATAKSLLAARAGERPWGWKEPRTALFLEAWQALAPDLRGVVVFRHPLAVHCSALRRRHWDLLLFPDQVLRAYAVYNAALWRAVTAAPERFLVVQAEAAFADLPALDAALENFLGQPPRRGELPEFYREEFAETALPDEGDAALRELAPAAMATYDALRSIAKLRLPGPVTPNASPEVGAAQVEAAAARAFAIPAFEARWCGESYPQLRRELATELGEKVRKTEEWNARAAKAFAENEWLEAERSRLGTAFAEQQVFLQQQTQDFEKLWKNHRKLGQSWVESNERVAAMGAHLKSLEDRLRALGDSVPPRPPKV